jgi:diguanylate cyclase (GGDEF)-like protein
LAGRILIIEDEALIRRKIRSTLESDGGFDPLFEADDGLSGFKVMMDQAVDLVVCDLVMPRFDGIKFLQLKASRPELANVPVIILTAETDPERKAEILGRGASDYVNKPFHDKELLARVRIHHKLKVLQDELREKNQLLETLSITDPLTLLFNRRYLMDRLEEQLARTARYGTAVSVVMIDLDRFKSINDTYGHPMGDEVLRNTSRLLRDEVRAVDVAARFGGEEFVLVLPQTDLEGAVKMAETLRKKIESLTHHLGGQALRATASFGVACSLAGGAALTPDGLLERADSALFAAKRGGRNRVSTEGVLPDSSAGNG